ncbi:hypothetical protein BKN38_03860 [Helicobacter sp. CLO-3]|uniref:divergent polysaccharide deacetylase family protein n=1 Tax=unclassified Helicobacter TaxID=2593540 RepID=UPI000805FA65|nr:MULTISPECIES: divergent polysaccharide deacetylase family protein [unclassified Helicobacter]OBV29864.1 hypothetical protein BA723_03990 [Helicobacter sp. CLO-3]OHU84056.1 hypothetical protein BKN38_03860 [Helicobacter sp. CLO-3]
MTNKVFKSLKILSTLVILALLGVGGYFGYGFYQEEMQKRAESSLDSSDKGANGDKLATAESGAGKNGASGPNADSGKDSDSKDSNKDELDIDWDGIMADAKNAKHPKDSANTGAKTDKSTSAKQASATSGAKQPSTKSSAKENPYANAHTGHANTANTNASDSSISKIFAESDSSATSTNPYNADKIKAIATQKPYLAIIMDDMSYNSQLQNLKKLRLPITPSFFPRSADTPDTPNLAKQVGFYMIHLPLEAMIPQKSAHKWIMTGDSIESMRANIAAIKRDFPSLLFLNNHTGSKFTASMKDMENLLAVLKEANIEFVDSRTSADTIVPIIYEQQGRKLLERNIFLDNTPSVPYTLGQLKLAVDTAKKNGYAIAICHPHTSTFQALAQARNTLFKDVELVYIRDLPIAREILASNGIELPPLDSSAFAAQNGDAMFISELEFEEEPKPSKIDKTMFEEVKRAKASNAKANASKNASAQKAITKPTQKGKTADKSSGASKDSAGKSPINSGANDDTCSRSPAEAFISGCVSDRKPIKNQEGFVDIQWSAPNDKDSSAPGKRPRDFLDSDDFIKTSE